MKLNEVLTKIRKNKGDSGSDNLESIGIYDKEGNSIVPYVENEFSSKEYLDLIAENPDVDLVVPAIYDGVGKDNYGKEFNYNYVRLIIYLEK